MKRQIGSFARHSLPGRRRERRQGVPHRAEDPTAFMAKPVQNVLRPRRSEGPIVGSHRMSDGPNMLTGMIEIENFHPALPRYA